MKILIITFLFWIILHIGLTQSRTMTIGEKIYLSVGIMIGAILMFLIGLNFIF